MSDQTDESLFNRVVLKGPWQEPAIDPQVQPRHDSTVSDTPTRKELELSIEASEARTDTKFAGVLGELKAINARLDVLPNTFTLVTTIVGTAVGVLALVVAILSFGSDKFGQGASVADIAKKAAQEVVAAQAAASKAQPSGTSP